MRNHHPGSSMAQGTEEAELSAPGTKAPPPPALRSPLAVVTVSQTCKKAVGQCFNAGQKANSFSKVKFDLGTYHLSLSHLLDSRIVATIPSNSAEELSPVLKVAEARWS